MSSFTCSSLYNNCANCNIVFNDVSQKSINIVRSYRVNNANDKHTVHILDAFYYIYGLSVNDFYVDDDCEIPFQNLRSDKTEYDNVLEKSIGLCFNCSNVFSDVYDFHKRFHEMSQEDSLLNRAVKHSRNLIQNIKLESNLESTDDSLDNEFVDIWNHENKNILMDKSDDCDYFVTDTSTPPHQKGSDCKNITPSGNIKKSSTKLTSKRKRGRPVKYKSNEANIKLSFKLKNASGKFKSGVQSLQLQPYVRLTRSRSQTEVSDSKYIISSDEGENDKEVRTKKRKITKRIPTCNDRKTSSGKRLNKSTINPDDELNLDIKSEVIASESIKDEDPLSGLQPGQAASVTMPGCTKIRRSSGERAVYICNICGEGVTRVKRFKVHMNSHKKAANKAKREKRVKTIKCTFCDKLFKNDEVLTNHIKVRHAGTRYNCDLCPQTFSRANGLKLHKKYLHNDEKQFECKICKMKYKWKGSLQSHEKTHENPRPHVCEVCGMSFTNKSNLNQHRTYHEDEGRDKELFKCKDCGKQLKNRKSLTKHVNAFHRPEMERIYTCDICGKTTKTSANLRTHQKIHDPNRILMRRKESGANSVKQTSIDNVKCLEDLNEPQSLQWF